MRFLFFKLEHNDLGYGVGEMRDNFLSNCTEAEAGK